MTKMRLLCAVALVMLISPTNADLDADFLINKTVWSVPAHDLGGNPLAGNPKSFPVDGDGDTCMETTYKMFYAWWIVDLGRDYEITDVKVQGEASSMGVDGARYLFAKAGLYKPDNGPGANPSVGAFLKQCVGTKLELSDGVHMNCDPGFRGRYLYIYLNVEDKMVLCEVTIGVRLCLIENCNYCNVDGSCARCENGTKLNNGDCQADFDPDFLINKTTWSVPVYGALGNPSDNPTSSPVDGVVHTCLKSVETHAWWAVDLGQDYEITDVRVWGKASYLMGMDGGKHFMANAGPVKPPLERGNAPTGPSFMQCVGTRFELDNGVHMTCDPGFHGHYLYIYLNIEDFMVLCEVMIGVKQLDPCEDFQDFQNEHAGGAEPHTAIHSLEDCKDACLGNDDCTAVDWDSNPGHTRCWLHMSPISTLRSASNVDHYRRGRQGPCQP